jgi:RHS repeat-associated protein
MSHRTLFYYDQESNVTCVRDADNGLTYFTYDLLNRMTSVKNPFGEVTYYDYTPDGQVKKRTLGNQTLTYYEYDDVGRVSKVDNRRSDLSVISTFEYEYDKVGNPTKITREDGSATYYQYDKIYQLTGETQVDAQGQVEYAFEYQYDKAHNRTVKLDNGTPTYYAYNEANELTHETTNGQTTYYQYDRCGNTTAKQEPSGTTYYLYDTENLLARIDFADGSHNYFGYDGDSKRVSARTSEGFTEFIYQGPDMLKLLLERDDQGVTQAHYTMGQGLEAMRRNSTSSFYHYNHLGTTHQLTDASQIITDTYRHDAWGVPLAQMGSTLNPHTYVGRERYYRLPQARLYQLGLRYYRSKVGTFMTIDPDRYSLNWLAYVENRVVVETDAWGALPPFPPGWPPIPPDLAKRYCEFIQRLLDIPSDFWNSLTCWKRVTDRYRNEAPPDYFEGEMDKFIHCNVTCHIQQECGPIDAAVVGFLREALAWFPTWLADRLPSPPVPPWLIDAFKSDASIADLWADFQGALCAALARNMECEECCGGCPLPTKAPPAPRPPRKPPSHGLPGPGLPRDLKPFPV